MLPLAFISDVFFSSAHAPDWLHDLASAFPVAPIARAMEAAFDPRTHAWPLSTTGLLTKAGWSTASVLLAAVAFRWEPGPVRPIRRRAVKQRRDDAGDGPGARSGSAAPPTRR
jgi:hypothetical protein